MNKRFRILQSLGAIAVATLAALAISLLARPRQAAPVSAQALPLDGFAIQILLGLKDAEPADWEGELDISPGAVRGLSAPSNPQAQVSGGKWSLRSRWQGPPMNKQMQVATLEAEFSAPATARVQVRTRRGNFAFTLGELRYGRPLLFLEGAAAVERVPASRQITRELSEDDFPSCAAAAGAVWCAYIAYQTGNPPAIEEVNGGKFDSLVTRGHGDRIRLLKFDGKQWSAPIDVTEGGLDVWRPAVAVDGKGTVWVAWSQNTAGDWELYGRGYQEGGGRWTPVQRITTDPGADVNVVAATGKSGRVWVAWQGWEKGDFAIRLQALDGGRSSRRTRNFPGANEWNPSLAADSQGKLHVAFDTYFSGNYDIYLWTLDEKTAAAGEAVPVANSPRFEARPSIAVDRQDRVWIAYEEAGANWAKDFGSRWEAPSGVPFYLDREIRVRCLAGGRWQQTRGEVQSDLIRTMYPPSDRRRLSYPRLGVDGQGGVWLAFRRHPLANGNGERWTSYAARYQGDAWTPPAPLPHSDNLLDNRPALAPLPGGGLLAVYSTDGRTAGTNTAQENNLWAAALAAEAAAAEPVLEAPAASTESSTPVHPNEIEDIRRLRAHRVSLGGKTYQLLRGEFHRHTEISAHRDQDGPLEDVWRYGLDAARMDWIGPADHDYGVGREYTWWLTQKQSEIYHHPPVFLPMFTYERSVVYPSGHRNAMFTKRGVRALPRLAPANQPELLYGTADAGSPDVKNFYAYLKFFDAICSSHTSATNMGTDWRDNDPAVEPVVEIYQGHRQNYEEPNAPKSATSAGDSIGGYEPAGYIWNAFAKGYRLGFQVSSDHVSTHISYAIVLAERPTREGILEAFKKRHSYGANDNIILDVRSGNYMMGDEFTAASPPRLEISVTGTGPVARVDIVRQIDRGRPEYVHAAEPKQASVKLSWTDAAPRAGAQHMYYVRVQQQDGKMAWASPMWIRYRP